MSRPLSPKTERMGLSMLFVSRNHILMLSNFHIYDVVYVRVMPQKTEIHCTEQKQPPEVFYKKAVLENFAIFTGKNLCWSLFLKKLEAFKPATLLNRNSNMNAE